MGREVEVFVYIYKKYIKFRDNIGREKLKVYEGISGDKE